VGKVEQVIAQETARIVEQAAMAAAKAVADAASAAALVMAEKTSQTSTAIAVLETKMNALQCQMNGIDINFKDIFKKLDDLSKGRPSWAVTVIISILSTACGSMTVYIATHI
jgi:hypothetical protein